MFERLIALGQVTEFSAVAAFLLLSGIPTMRLLSTFIKGETGPTSVEYAVLLAMILLTIIASIAVLGTETNALWADIDGDMTDHGM